VEIYIEEANDCCKDDVTAAMNLCGCVGSAPDTRDIGIYEMKRILDRAGVSYEEANGNLYIPEDQLD